MARKKKGQLPSGNVRIQRIVGHTRDGKPIRKSFTGATKADAEYLYREYMLNPPKEKTGSLTLCAAVSRYIDMKAGVLSPSTIRGYTGLLRTHIEGSEIGGIDLEDLTAKDLQLWISDLSRDRTPKTVRNASALVRSSIEMFNPDFRYRVTLPQPQRPDLYCPSDDDVRQLLSCIEDRDLRHYSASIMHAIGVPDQYIMSRGGWSTDNVMKRVYRNVIDLEEAKQTRKITEHFSTLAK